MRRQSQSKVGVYIDVQNMYMNGGRGMRYDVLREFAARDDAELVRLNAYVSYDADRARVDNTYHRNVNNFYSLLRDFGYKVIIKEVKWYEEESGHRYGKANADLELAVDALLQSENLDRVLIATGDGDFIQVVRALQNRGCRVEIVGLDNVSSDLRREADMFISGYLVPSLIPTPANGESVWGEIGARVRGVCHFHDDMRKYGLLRYLKSIGPGLWLTDSRHPDSPYETVFFHDTNLPPGFDASQLPSRRHVFEFMLVSREFKEGMQAADMRLISMLRV